MGITRKSLSLLNNALWSNYGGDTSHLNLLELGIQESAEGGMHFQYMQDVAKDKFYSYISLDLHDNPRVTTFDLSVHEPDAFVADIITNFGTTEHVEYEEGQYNCWQNIHNWLSVGGVGIHLLPEIGSWKGHCRYYTDMNFYREFEKYGYEVQELGNYVDENGNMNWCVMKKLEVKPFMDMDSFYKLMHIDSNVTFDQIHTLNNPKNLR